MTKVNIPSRRDFLKHTSLGFGGSFFNFHLSPLITASADHNKHPLDLIVATIDLKDASDEETDEQRLNRVMRHMKAVAGLKPDIICLPEEFSHSQRQRSITSIAHDRAVSSKTTKMIADYARQNKCYLTCPLITRQNETFFNSVLLFNREGRIAGIYDNMFPGKTQLTHGAYFSDGRISPGSPDQKPVETEYGPIAFQTGEDVYRPAAWKRFAEKGVKLIIYSSTFSGGRILNYHAVTNHCFVISAANQESRIVDVSGNNLDKTSEFIRYSWAMINMERTNILTLPNRLPDLFRKYGNRLQFKVWGNTDMLTIESHDPSLKVKDVLKAFDLPTYAELISNETRVQDQYRPKG